MSNKEIKKLRNNVFKYNRYISYATYLKKGTTNMGMTIAD